MTAKVSIKLHEDVDEPVEVSVIAATDYGTTVPRITRRQLKKAGDEFECYVYDQMHVEIRKSFTAKLRGEN